MVRAGALAGWYAGLGPEERLVTRAGLLAAVVYLASLKLSQLLSPRLFASYSRLSRDDKLEWDGRLPSTLHAVFITLITAYLFLSGAFADTGPAGGVPFVLRTSALSTAALGGSLGYFAVDLLLLLACYPCFGGPEMAVHHVAALTSVAASGVMAQGQAYTLALLATECTTPLINARWVLDKSGMRESPWYTANGLGMLLSWLGARIVLFLFFFEHMYHHRAELSLLAPLTFGLVATVPALLFALNLFWFSKILQGALKLLGKKTKGQPGKRGAATAEGAAHKQD